MRGRRSKHPATSAEQGEGEIWDPAPTLLLRHILQSLGKSLCSPLTRTWQWVLHNSIGTNTWFAVRMKGTETKGQSLTAVTFAQTQMQDKEKTFINSTYKSKSKRPHTYLESFRIQVH